MSPLLSTTACALALIAAGAAASGCAVGASATPVGYAELTYATTYTYYPHTTYEGRDVYYVGGRWMYRDGSAWSYYVNEPTPLYRYRTTVRQAPPAPRYYPDSGYVYPAQPVPAPPSSPPPARVR
ncbi:MAG: hypothetical protein KF795_28615 [Labilithrix sp.]|nr:hypothetical protein [Labilithrix sp.]